MKLTKVERLNRAMNLRFKRATKAQRRVLIAQDVIARVKSKQFRATSGTWAELYSSEAPDEASAQTLINSGTPCQCCALGGMMLSCVAFKNEVTYSEAVDYDAFDGGTLLSGLTTKPGLEKIFSIKQLAMIEYCFEDGSGATGHSSLARARVSGDEIYAMDEFISHHVTSKDTILAIMNNIVEHKGKFVP